VNKSNALYKQVELEFGNVGFYGERKPENWRRTLRARTRTNNKLNPHDTGTGNQTRDTLVGGERSHHCAIPAPTP